MSTATIATTPTSKLSRASLWFVVVLTGLFALIHAFGVFGIADGEDERLAFTCFAAVNALSLVILLVPLRAGEGWAWAASWIQVLVNALVPIIGEKDLVIPYLPLAVLMAVGLVFARPKTRP